MNDLILHPTASTPVPVTICPPRQRKARVRKEALDWTDLTCEELRAACVSRGLKPTTKHVKAELIAMARDGLQVRPAALDRENARRKAKRAAQ